MARPAFTLYVEPVPAQRVSYEAKRQTSFLMAASFVEPRMTDLIERLVPDESWALFRRVVPPTEVIRPQGGGRRWAGDRECLAAIVFVATSGRTWRQPPPVSGPAHGPPALRPVEPGPGLGPAAPGRPRRTRRAG
ncbi:hypothetical protein GCM10010421_47650 [Streptomyces glaucus]|uniref:Transposase n=1 Tax=Streptomyces glaucus TaxID=284029 RepID=A0ABP5XCY4_9ACTN